MMLEELGDYEFHQELIDQNEEYWHANMCYAEYVAGWFYISNTLGLTIDTIYNVTPTN